MSDDFGSGFGGGGLFSGGSTRSGVSAWRSEWSNIRSLQAQLDDQVAAAASHQQRVSSQLARVQGDLSHRVERLSQAFDAFVELSELRETLVLYTEARRWRLLAKAVIEGAVSTRQMPRDVAATGLDDVSGYWLVPAIKALPGILEGRPDAALLGEAIGRDEMRTATFVSCVAPVLGHPEMVSSWLATALRPGDGALSHAQRVLWLAALDGTLPDGSVTVVRDAVHAQVGAADRDARIAAVSAAMPSTSTSKLASAGVRARDATVTIRQWLAWAHDLVGSPTGGRAAAGAAVAAASSPSGPERSTADALLDVVRSLVEEGSADERDLLDRAEQLRATISGAAAPTATTWDETAGTALDLLCQDLRNTGGARASRFACSLLADELTQIAGGLLGPTQAAAPTTASVKALGGVVDVGVEGPNDAQAQALLAANASLAKPIAPPAVLGAGVAVVLVLAVLGAVASAAFVLLAALAAVAIALVWLTDRTRSSAAAEQNGRAAEQLHTALQQAQGQLAADTAEAANAASDGALAHVELMAALAELSQ